jgi:hypothetical protein
MCFAHMAKQSSHNQIHEIVHFKNDILKVTRVIIYALNAKHINLAKISGRNF